MLVKGIIETIDNSGYSAKVRVPIYNKLQTDLDGTPTKDLDTAAIASLPGISPGYKVGDVVIVDYENDDVGTPIITGLLHCENQSSSTSDINCNTLNVNINYALPNASNEPVGNTTNSSAITAGASSESTIDLNNKINTILAMRDKMYPVGAIYLSVNSANPCTIFGGTWQQSANPFQMKFDNLTTTVYVWTRLS